MHIQAGKHIVTDGHPVFHLFKDGEGNRHFDHVVKFEQKFDSAPQVLVALNHVDAGPEVKVQVAAENITATGFVLRYSTWANARRTLGWRAMDRVSRRDIRRDSNRKNS